MPRNASTRTRKARGSTLEQGAEAQAQVSRPLFYGFSKFTLELASHSGIHHVVADDIAGFPEVVLRNRNAPYIVLDLWTPMISNLSFEEWRIRLASETSRFYGSLELDYPLQVTLILLPFSGYSSLPFHPYLFCCLLSGSGCFVGLIVEMLCCYGSFSFYFILIFVVFPF